ncbi:hypothetical protein PR048_008668 [Dryococelus australis]|uniref:CCHC-type domain-containing protein n=1 Tax=Dryococelus australis TaxID=614101 RepID=A0ABQ9HXS1_9NEOP|nr:hypothetical protein PR048_008668 [Dryococelus australis]
MFSCPMIRSSFSKLVNSTTQMISPETKGEIDPILLKANQGLLQGKLSQLASLDEHVFENLLTVGKSENELHAELNGSNKHKVETKLRELEKLNITSYKYTAILFPLVESCLTEELLRAWQLSGTMQQGENRLNSLMDFLKREVEQEERISLALRGFHLNRCEVSPRGTGDMFKARKITVGKKCKIVGKKSCCFTCLRTGHVAKECRMTCFVCGGNHIPILCPKLEENVHPSQVLSPTCNEGHTLSNCPVCDVLLQTLLVKIKGNTVPIARRVTVKEELQYLGVKLDDDSTIQVLVGADILGILLTGKSIVLNRCTEKKLFTILDGVHSFFFGLLGLWFGILDVLGIEDHKRLRTKENRISAIREHFEESLKWKDGRYQVELPWKEEHDPLPTNVEDWKKEEIIEEVKPYYQNEGHCLLKDDGTTKMRPVFDASSRVPPNHSLNDYLTTCVTSVEPDTLHLFIEESKQIFQKAGIDLSGWELMDLAVDPEEMPTILGFLWIRGTDTLSLNVSVSEPTCIVSKREILSTAHNIFDPVGMETSVTLISKLLMQKLWQEDLSWDEQFPPVVEDGFREWMKTLPCIRQIAIPRYILKKQAKLSLHIFADSTQHTCTVVIFLRVGSSGDVELDLVEARARVISRNKTTIPRLELFVATIAARLVASLVTNLQLKTEDLHFWSDSTTIISWIQHDEQWSVFLYNWTEKVVDASLMPWSDQNGGRVPTGYDMCRQNGICGQEKYMRIALTSSESNADVAVVKLIQKESFHDPEDKHLSSLRPYKDHCGALHLGTMISERKDRPEFIHLAIFPGDHLVMATRKVLVLKRIRVTRSPINNCVECRQFLGPHVEQNFPPPPLPEDRVCDASVFEVIGVDMYLKDSTEVWICIFSCAVYRAEHLEVASYLSTDAFIQALRRFIAHRGRPTTIYSDNGANFVGVENAFFMFNLEEIICFSSGHTFVWKFNPPTAVWWGGWWEHLGGLLKYLLQRTMGKALHTEFKVTYLYLRRSSESGRILLQNFREIGVPDCDKLDSVDTKGWCRYLQSPYKDLRGKVSHRISETALHQVKGRNSNYNTDRLPWHNIVSGKRLCITTCEIDDSRGGGVVDSWLSGIYKEEGDQEGVGDGDDGGEEADSEEESFYLQVRGNVSEDNQPLGKVWRKYKRLYMKHKMTQNHQCKNHRQVVLEAQNHVRKQGQRNNFGLSWRQIWEVRL